MKRHEKSNKKNQIELEMLGNGLKEFLGETNDGSKYVMFKFKDNSIKNFDIELVRNDFDTYTDVFMRLTTWIMDIAKRSNVDLGTVWKESLEEDKTKQEKDNAEN